MRNVFWDISSIRGASSWAWGNSFLGFATIKIIPPMTRRKSR
jgi:hypothetical protein